MRRFNRTSNFEPAYRVLSFLVLGTVRLIESLVFTRLGKRQSATSPLEESHH